VTLSEHLLPYATQQQQQQQQQVLSTFVTQHTACATKEHACYAHARQKAS
jgi:hypothetical protein